MLYNEKIMTMYDTAIIKRCGPAADLEKILEKAKRLSAGSKVLQLFDASAVFSREHLLFAYANAMLATIEKRSRSKSMAMEMMLYAALTLQISEAIKIAGLKSGSSIVLFSNSSEAYDSIRHMLSSIEDLAGTNSSALKKLGAKNIDDIISKMSLLSISD